MDAWPINTPQRLSKRSVKRLSRRRLGQSSKGKCIKTGMRKAGVETTVQKEKKAL